MNIQIDSAIKRARGYWFIDGFIEMAAGGFFVLLAALLLFRGSASPTTFSPWFLSVAGEITIAKFIGIVAIILLLWWLKDHFTYPRTGFVRNKRITAAQILMIIRNVLLFLLMPIFGLLAIALLIVSLGIVLAAMPIWFPIGISFVWAAFFLLAGGWMGLPRFRVLGGLILLTGMAIGIWQFAIGLPTFPVNLQPGFPQPAVVESINRTLTSLSLLVLISGVVLIFSGIITFLNYRKENPTPYQEEA